LLQGYYLSTSRELTRLESITKAPVIHHFSETIVGVMTIRCFRKQQRFTEENVNRVNASIKMDFHNNGANEWLGFRLELIGACVLCTSALLMVMLPSNFIEPGICLIKFPTKPSSTETHTRKIEEMGGQWPWRKFSLMEHLKEQSTHCFSRFDRTLSSWCPKI